MSLKIVSLNVWRGAVYGPLLEFLSEQKADIYCLQEILDYPKQMVLHTESSSGTIVDVHLDLLAALQKVLPGYQCYFNQACVGRTYDETHLTHLLRYGIAMFIREDVSVAASFAGMVHDRFRKLAPLEFPTPRVAHFVRVWDSEEDHPVVIGHVHGLWVEEGKADNPQRHEQAKRLLALVRKAAPHGDVKVVLCGDFNILPGSITFSVLAEAGLTDLVTSRGIETTRTSLYKKPIPHADYLFVSDFVEVEEFDVPAAPEVSDHRALIIRCA